MNLRIGARVRFLSPVFDWDWSVLAQHGAEGSVVAEYPGDDTLYLVKLDGETGRARVVLRDCDPNGDVEVLG